jgi:hypothetical protein
LEAPSTASDAPGCEAIAVPVEQAVVMLAAELTLGTFNHLYVVVVTKTLVGNDTDPTAWREFVQSATPDYRVTFVSERRTVEVYDLLPTDVDVVMGVRNRT